jgi:hypothetical protein
MPQRGIASSKPRPKPATSASIAKAFRDVKPVQNAMAKSIRKAVVAKAK